MRTSYNTVDVRGLRLRDAEAKVDQFIKAGIPQNRKVVYILHGHGTGAFTWFLAGGWGRFISIDVSNCPFTQTTNIFDPEIHRRATEGRAAGLHEAAPLRGQAPGGRGDGRRGRLYPSAAEVKGDHGPPECGG